MKLRLLDLFCKAGAAGGGYSDCGPGYPTDWVISCQEDQV